jgi:DNA repair and recombination protein RAD54B
MAKKKAELAALNQWTHINCLRPDAKADVHDDILRKLIHSAEPPQDIQTNCFKKPLPDSIGLDHELSLDVSTENLPGGTISFLFERTAKDSPSVIDEADS